MPSPGWTYLDSAVIPGEILDRISRSKRIAVDTEADSLHHYREKLCLLQIATDDEIFVIDPLASDVSGLLDRMQRIPLIFHGADYDLRLIRKFHVFEPVSLFDTMIAAQYLGVLQPGLAVLVKTQYEVELVKSSQKADWSERPLKPTLLEYAANDVRFLHGIADKLTEELKLKGRLGWHEEACRRVLESSRGFMGEGTSRQWRVKGWKDVPEEAHAALAILWNWREEEAKRRDLPTFKVFQNEWLVKIAQWVHKHPGQSIGKMSGLPRNFRSALIAELDQALRSGKPSLADFESTETAEASKRRRLTRSEEKKLEALRAERKLIASELGLDPGVLISNAMLEETVRQKPSQMGDWRRVEGLFGWQIQILGERLLKILAIGEA